MYDYKVIKKERESLNKGDDDGIELSSRTTSLVSEKQKKLLSHINRVHALIL